MAFQKKVGYLFFERGQHKRYRSHFWVESGYVLWFTRKPGSESGSGFTGLNESGSATLFAAVQLEEDP
jgi:hypothetical protein